MRNISAQSFCCRCEFYSLCQVIRKPQNSRGIQNLPETRPTFLESVTNLGNPYAVAYTRFPERVQLLLDAVLLRNLLGSLENLLFIVFIFVAF